VWDVEEVGEGGTAGGAVEVTSFMNWTAGTAAVGPSSSGRVFVRERSRSGSRGDSAGGAYGGGDAFRRGASLDEESRHMRPARKSVWVRFGLFGVPARISRLLRFMSELLGLVVTGTLFE
jgi:hypothetical protein